MHIQFVTKLEQNSPLTVAGLPFRFSYRSAEQRRIKSGVHKSQTPGGA